MTKLAAHPHARALLGLERPDGVRLEATSLEDIFAHLFVADHLPGDLIVIQQTGAALTRLFARSLAGTDFCHLFAGADRLLIRALAAAVARDKQAGFARAKASNLDGGRTEVEIVLAPGPGASLVGLYQPTTTIPGAIARQRLDAIYPPMLGAPGGPLH